MENEPDWWDRTFRLHEQSHIYWKSIVSIPIVVIGWSVLAKQDLSNQGAIVICFLLGILQLFFTQGLIRLYRLFRASFKEFSIQANKTNSSSPFAVEASKFKPLPAWLIILISVMLYFVSVVLVYFKSGSA